jgi:hypothetical protein
VLAVQNLPAPLKMAVGGLGGVVVAIGVVVITASALGVDLTGAAHPAPGAVTAVTAAPTASPRPGAGQANPAARALNQAVVEAEAQVLGMQPRDLSASLRQGTTVHQLAMQRRLGPADFQAAFQRDLRALLDRDVQQGTLTAAQEQAALRRLDSRLPPNWDLVQGARAGATPTPAAPAS